MGLVWPAYLNVPAIELRSSIPVHITQENDKPPPGTRGDRELGGREDGNERFGVFWSGFKVNIGALLYQRMVFTVTPFTFFASVSQCHFAAIKMSYLLVH